jgi:AraC-like DNA-binding protein
MAPQSFTLLNPHNGALAFRVTELADEEQSDTLRRLNYYTIILVTGGQGEVQAATGVYPVAQHDLLYFSLYQPFSFRRGTCTGFVLNFQPDFFCIYKHDKEVACDGILFNNIYQSPFHRCEEAVAAKLLAVLKDMREEMQQEALAQHDLLVSLLKVFLIQAARSKLQAAGTPQSSTAFTEKPMLQELKKAIEVNYRSKHSAGDYAGLLNITPKALSRLVKHHFSRTLTDIIADRIIAEAKRELYLTPKPVKAIAHELGFADSYHFSRFFKNKTAVSPALYRTQVKYTKAPATV